MPEEGVQLKPKDEYMQADELLEMAQVFVDLGVKKIRLTGGEPLLRKDAEEIIRGLAAMDVELGLTTNGILLDRYIDLIKELDIRLNLSLDSLNKEKNFKIVKRDYFERIMKNMNLALAAGIYPSINCVLMSEINEDEVYDFIGLTKDIPIKVRFIEFMPFNGNQWQFEKCVPDARLMERIRMHFGYEAVQSIPLEKNHIARNYRIEGYKGTFGLISTVTEPFCSSCNRIRLTADGRLKNCLFSTDEVDLLTAYRNGENLLPLIAQNIEAKKAVRAGIDVMDNAHLMEAEENRSMIRIGG